MNLHSISEKWNWCGNPYGCQETWYSLQPFMPLSLLMPLLMSQSSTTKIPLAWEKQVFCLRCSYVLLYFILPIFYLTTYPWSNILFSYCHHFISSRFLIRLICYSPSFHFLCLTLFLCIFCFVLFFLFYDFLYKLCSS